MPSVLSARLPQLDFLRGTAVLMVLLNHQGYLNELGKGGWAGVDLFFVLSGFLVSGLLFTEYKNTGTVRPVRFLIRRGFKIYPLYYSFVAVWLLQASIRYYLLHQAGYNFQLNQIYGVLVFVQNYAILGFGPTWTLAVEEHFYLLSALLLTFAGSLPRFLASAKFVAWVSPVLLLVLWLRQSPNAVMFPYQKITKFYTHLRLDSLLAGMLLAWFWHFRNHAVRAFAKAASAPLALLGIFGFILPYLLPQDSLNMQTWGRSLLYVCFSALLLLFITHVGIGSAFNAGYAKPFMRFVAGLGFYSYAIYLFHIIFLEWRLNLAFPDFDFSFSTLPSFLLFMAASILGGIAASKLIEQPFLRLRENFAKSANPVQTES